jgi:NAD(P)-dependent dehydrogenase (short-subunit alcohol dehydrogenase family)
MEVLVIGGHGQIGLRLLRLLARDGHRGCGVIRKAEQASDLEAAGAGPVLCDLERGDDLRPHIGTADAIVFAAGTGPGSVLLSRTFGRRADVPRDDVALVLLECLHAPNTIGVEFEQFESDVPAREAVRSRKRWRHRLTWASGLPCRTGRCAVARMAHCDNA